MKTTLSFSVSLIPKMTHKRNKIVSNVLYVPHFLSLKIELTYPWKWKGTSWKRVRAFLCDPSKCMQQAVKAVSASSQLAEEQLLISYLSSKLNKVNPYGIHSSKCRREGKSNGTGCFKSWTVCGLSNLFSGVGFFFFFLNSEYVFGTAAVQDTPCKEAQIPRQGFLVQRNINCPTRLSWGCFLGA